MEQSKSRRLRLTELPPDIVDVWEAPHSGPDDDAERLFDLLSGFEQIRAKRFVDTRGYRQYVISRARMRQVLAHYTGVPAAEVHFTIVGDGKPALSDRRHDIFFNNTHSGELGLIAVTRGREVGIDMERFRDIERARRVSKRFFTAEEHASLIALEGDEMVREFLSIWTRREAGTKARGASVWRGLGSWTGSRMARRPGVQADETTEFTTRMLDLGNDYVGAVVAAGTDWAVRMRGDVRSAGLDNAAK
jgi:4'-phosphopantetheinyl transferase